MNLAKITGGENLPVVYKVGESNYKTFTTIEELQIFNVNVSNHINSTIKK
ncbi:hypothetical protein L950_0221550 [Sphingobacterium sp. IITKGP-BTPF85]|nr:hypothetical protein L950_0221550 [Sphingobacterium sp. IITKGP-BTPF85]